MTAAVDRPAGQPNGGDRQVRIVGDERQLAIAAAEEIRHRAAAAIAARGRFLCALAGGSTPRRTYELLGGSPRWIDWTRTVVCWGDERCVPPDHPDSNFGVAQRLLLSRVPVPAAAVHRIRGELPAVEAAAAYESRLRSLVAPGEKWLRFDLVLLGLGRDGHTASLFPGDRALAARRRWVSAARAPAPPRQRVTLTVPLLDRAAAVLFLVTGSDKAATVARVLASPISASAAVLPAARVRPRDGRVVWLLDRAAGAGPRARGGSGVGIDEGTGP